MAQQGVVKRFIRNGGRNYGFLYVLDKDGNRTGDEVFFHLDNARQVIAAQDDSGMSTVNWRARATLEQLGRMPRTGDVIVFETSPHRSNPGLPKAVRWTFETIWFDERRLAEEMFDDQYGWDDEPLQPDYDDEDDYVPTSTVYGRAHRHFGNAELTREATELYSGDFI